MPASTRLVYINTNNELEIRSRLNPNSFFVTQYLNKNWPYYKPYVVRNLDLWQGYGRFSDCIPKILWRGNLRYDVYYLNSKKQGTALRYRAISTKKNVPILDRSVPLNFTADGSITPYDPGNGFVYLFYQRDSLLYCACYRDSDDREMFVNKPVNADGSQIGATGSVSITSTGPGALQRYMCWTPFFNAATYPLAYATLTFSSNEPDYPSLTVTGQVKLASNSLISDSPKYSPSIIYKETRFGGKYLRIFHCASTASLNARGNALACYTVSIASGAGPAIRNRDYPVLIEAADGSGKAIYALTATAPQAYSSFNEVDKDYTDVYVVDPLTRQVQVLFIDTDDLRIPVSGITPAVKRNYFWVGRHSLLKPDETDTNGYVSDFNMAVSVDSGSEFTS